YTQSDEISLIFYSDRSDRAIFLDGRIQKMTSILASMATAMFNAGLPDAIPEKEGRRALFDCRVWTVPTREEAANVLLWRELDATKNSISMAARAHYSHNALHGKSGAQMQELLWQKGVNWNDYPAFFKRGTFVRRETTRRRFSAEELEKLPPKHAARQNPDLVVERTDVRVIEMPPFRTVTNRVAAVFEGATPEVAATPS
ncbi:MAG: hypothetical protein H6739_42435, partial [Alphaproteobacteria bacterium]|nr:hypothetical protein [Alphaproteobacteria bacterium]